LTPERWAQIEELFHRAAECEPEHRSGLLDEVCSGDPELRREVEALLSNQQSAGDHLKAAVSVGLDAVGFPLVGETISHYRILDGLGEGGMGLVYRAEDVRLGRQVALKFLPEELAKDPAALARFEREARTASSLEHPNICPIYEFGEHQGQPFLVMQLLEGQTLKELLDKQNHEESKSDSHDARKARRLPLDQVLDLAIQIADGLHAAHQKGIVHRDIKPANIFVTSQNQAKILDFGLAKLARTATEEDAESAGGARDISAKRTAGETAARATPDPFLSRTGVAMGTAGYMSPEQARGEKLDARTDLFSFGLVLYEMATGQRAFKGDTWPVLRDAILKSTPESLGQFKSELPAKLGKIINKALEKDRDARYQSAAELLADLQSLKQATEHRSRWREAATGAAALLLLLTVVYWVYERRQPRSLASPEPKLTQLTVNSFENRVKGGAISPDGKYLAYTDINGMYIKLIGTGQIWTVPQPEGFNGKNVEWEIVPPAWFPDSSRFVANAHPAAQDPILWSSQDTSIWMVSVLGGAPHKLRDKAVAFSVSPDGSLISYGTNKGKFGELEIWLMAPNGERERKVLDTDENSSIGGFLWAPNGQRANYYKTDERGDSFLSRDLNGGPTTTIFSPSEMKKIVDISWLPDGRLLFSVHGLRRDDCDYWTVHVDPRTGNLMEKPRQLTNWAESCVKYASVSADGKRLAFLKGTMRLTSYVADLAAGGTRILNLRRFPLSESSAAASDWTSDSKYLLNVSTRGGNLQLYKQLLDEETEEPLVPEGYGRNPRATPDGKWVLYLGRVNTGEPPEKKAEPVMRVPIEGGPPQKLFTAKPLSMITCASPASKMCAIAEPSEDRTQVIVSSLDPLRGRGPELTRFAIDPNGDPGWALLSPDGTRIVSMGSPPGSIHILSLRGQPTQEIKLEGWSNTYLFEPTWVADGRGLYVSADSRGGKVLLYMDLQGNARVLWEGAGATAETLAYASPDGRHLMIQTWTNNDNMWLMENF
jgi:eukaryotic-like serine/threonine-protein kinase